MKILFKYISKLFFGPFLIGLGGFIVFVSVELLYQLSNIIVRNRVGIDKLFVLIYYNLPSFTSDGIPVGVLLAIFWIISTLSHRRELMAFQVHGISLKNLFFPFLVLSLLLSGAVYLLNDFVVPNYYVKAEQYMSEKIFKKPKVEDYIVSESVIRYKDKFIYVGEYDKKHEVMKDVMIIDYSGGDERVMTAKKVYRSGRYWYLEDGRLYIVDDRGMMRLDSVYKNLKLNFGEDLGILLAYPSARKMSHSELIKAIGETRDRKRAAKWIVELQRRYATALAPVIIVLAGLSLSLLFNLTSKSWGVILTFVLIVLYQGSEAWLSAMGKEMIIDPVLAVWLPNILFGGVGLVLLLFVDTVAVQKVREILVRAGLGVLLIFPVIGLGYTVESRLAILSGDVVTMIGDVKIYDKGDLKATAEKAIYYISEDQMILFDATSVGKNYSLKAMAHMTLNGVSYDRGVSGEISSKGGNLTIRSASVVVSSGDIRIIKDADLDVTDQREKLKSSVKAVFLISDKNGIKNGMGLAKGEKAERNFEVEVARISGSKDMKGVIGMMKVKLGKNLKNMYFAGNSLLILKDNLQLSGAYITTCSMTPPHYYIAFEKAYVTEDYVAARNTMVFINDFPMVYFPYFFQFFRTPKPVSMSFGIGSKSKGVSFAFYTEESGWKSIYKKSGGRSEFSLSGAFLSFPVSLSWKNGRTGITVKKLLFDGSLGISSAGKTVVYQYSFKKKLLKSSTLGFLLKRYYSNGRVSWLLPNVYLGKLKVGVPIIGGSMYVKSWTHTGTLSYSEGSIFENLGKISGKGKIVASYSRSLVKFTGSSLGNSLKVTYDATPGGFRDYELDQTTAISVYNKKFDLNWISLSAQKSLSISTSFKKGWDEMSKSLCNSEKYSLALKMPFISGSLNYEKSDSYSGKEKFERSSVANKLGLSSSLSFPFIPLVISASTGYDFLSENPRFSYPDLSAKSSFSIGDFSLSFSASTKYRYDMERIFDRIDFSSSQAYRKNRFKNSLSFSYFFGDDVPVKEITDKFSAKSLPIFGLEISEMSGIAKYNFKEDGSKLTYFSTKFISNFNSAKHSLLLRYRSPVGFDRSDLSLNYSLSTYKVDPVVKMGFGMSLKDMSLSAYSFSLSLKKKLHCWTMGIDLEGRMSEDGIEFSKLFLSFSINDLSGKGFNYDLISGEYNLGLM